MKAAICIGYFKVLLLVGTASVFFACGGSYEVDPDWTPGERRGLTDNEMMVSASHPLAVDAGLAVLGNGGNAVDAAVALQMVLNVVEPPESGIGGGSFMLYYQKSVDELMLYDGRETAPESATSGRFAINGRPLPLWAAVPTGLSVGVPGTLAMLYKAHQEHGNMDWMELFDPAIRLAETGVPMSGRLQRQIDNDPSLWLYRNTRTFFVNQRRKDDPGLQNPELAETLRSIARGGPDVFYRGELTRNMIEAAGKRWPGRSDLDMDDFANYSAIRRNAVCLEYRTWKVCGAPAPTSGGITLLQILGILEHFHLQNFEPGDPEAIHLIAEASRLAFADRAAYIGDPDFTTVPREELLDDGYLASRAAWIDRGQALKEVNPGVTSVTEPSLIRTKNGTTGTAHFSIVDREGNAVAMTSSIESPFGSRIMTNGFLLNNQLTDFDFSDQITGFSSPNAVEGGKRPRSSMAPAMVFDREGNLRLIVGSRGGSRIIGYVLKTIIGVLDWGLTLQDAAAMPNFLHRGDVLELEAGSAWEHLADTMKSMGHRVRVLPLESGIHGIERVSLQKEETGRGREEFKWQGGADPRMEGDARGPSSE